MVSLSQMSLMETGLQVAMPSRKRAKYAQSNSMRQRETGMPLNPAFLVNTLKARKEVMEQALRPHFGNEVTINPWSVRYVPGHEGEEDPKEHITLSNLPFQVYDFYDLSDDILPIFSMDLIWDKTYALTIRVTPYDKTSENFANALGFDNNMKIMENEDPCRFSRMFKKDHLFYSIFRIIHKIQTESDFYQHALPVLVTMAGILFRYSMLHARLAELYPQHTVASSNKHNRISVKSTNGHCIWINFGAGRPEHGEIQHASILSNGRHSMRIYGENAQCMQQMQSILAAYYVDPAFFYVEHDAITGSWNTIQRFERADEIEPLCDAFAVVEKRFLA